MQGHTSADMSLLNHDQQHASSLHSLCSACGWRARASNAPDMNGILCVVIIFSLMQGDLTVTADLCEVEVKGCMDVIHHFLERGQPVSLRQEQQETMDTGIA